MTTSRPHGPDCCEVTDPPAYLDPVRDELDRLRTENADLTQELATVRDTLRHRSNALNATGTHNDQLRATLARVKKLADEVDAVREYAGTPMPGRSGGTWPGKAMSTDALSARLRAILADKEPTP